MAGMPERPGEADVPFRGARKDKREDVLLWAMAEQLEEMLKIPASGIAPETWAGSEAESADVDCALEVLSERAKSGYAAYGKGTVLLVCGSDASPPQTFYLSAPAAREFFFGLEQLSSDIGAAVAAYDAAREFVLVFFGRGERPLLRVLRTRT